MNRLKLTIITIILGLTLSFSAFAAGNATLTLSPASGEYQIGETFNVSITTNNNEEKIDTVRVNLSFPADKLEITNFSFGSLYSYPTVGNTYDNATGTLIQGAGHPGGTTQSGVFGTITFKVKAAGKATVTIASNSMMISLGEEKFNGKSFSASYNLVAPPPPPEEEEEVETPVTESKLNPEEAGEEAIIAPDENVSEENEPKPGEIEEISDRMWMATTIILSVFFGLAGYYFGRTKSRVVRRR